MSRQKPYTYEQVWNPHAACWDLDKTKPLYRRSPTHKEEQAVVRAALVWRDDLTNGKVISGRLVSAVDRLLAKRKKAKP